MEASQWCTRRDSNPQPSDPESISRSSARSWRCPSSRSHRSNTRPNCVQILRCSSSPGNQIGIRASSFVEMWGTPLLRPGSISETNAGERSHSQRKPGSRRLASGVKRATRCRRSAGRSSVATRATFKPVEIKGRSKARTMSPASSANRSNSTYRSLGRDFTSLQLRSPCPMFWHRTSLVPESTYHSLLNA